MAKQGYPSNGSRYGNHPSVGGYPVAGTRYGAHPDGGAAVVPTPLQLGAQFWFDPSQLSANQGDTVAALPNLADTSMLTQLVASGAGRQVQQIRGLKALKFLRTSVQTFGNPLLSGSITYPFYVFLVHCSNDPNAVATLVGGAPSSADTFRCRNVGTANVYPRGHTMLGSSAVSQLATTAAGQPRVMMFAATGPGSIIRTNGASDGVGTTGTLAISGLGLGIDSGGGNTYGGCIGEMFVRVGTLTSGDIALGLSYLENKWLTTAPRRSVLCLGDSNTNGFGTTVNDCSYRGPLERWGQTAPGGYYVDFMGPVQFSFLANSNHAGYNGATILDHLNGSVPLNMSTPAQLAANGYLADVKVLLIGTNDANNNSGTPGYEATMLTNYAALLAAWRSAHPGGKIIACTLPQSQTAGTNSNVAGFNAGLPAVIATENGLGGAVTLCDINSALGANPGTNGYWQDNLHWTPVGASVVSGAIQPVLQSLF